MFTGKTCMLRKETFQCVAKLTVTSYLKAHNIHTTRIYVLQRYDFSKCKRGHIVTDVFQP